MEEIVSSNSAQYLQTLEPMRSEINRIVVNIIAHKSTVQSPNGEVKVEISGEYEITSIELAESLFLLDKEVMEIIIIHALNQAMLEIWVNNRSEIYVSPISEVLILLPNDLLSIINKYKNDFKEELLILSKKEEVFLSKDNKLIIRVTGGVNFISIDIQKDLLIQSKKKS